MVTNKVTKGGQPMTHPISLLLGKENMTVIHKPVIEFFNYDRNIATMAEQFCYWQDKITREDGGIYKSYKQWHDEVFLTQYQISKSAKKLKQLGYLTTKLKQAALAHGRAAPVIHYYFNYDKFYKSFMKFLNKRLCSNSINDYGETQQTITETTTEITTKTTIPSLIEPNLKNEYGEFNNVFLTDKERNKLIEHYGEADALRRIETLSAYLASKGKDPYKSHYATIRKWALGDNKNISAGRAGKRANSALPSEAELEKAWGK